MRLCRICMRFFPATPEHFYVSSGFLRRVCRSCMDRRDRERGREPVPEGDVLCICGKVLPEGEYFCSNECKSHVVSSVLTCLATGVRRRRIKGIAEVFR